MEKVEGFYLISSKMICAREETGLKKHSEVRPQGGQVYNYKALQYVAGEPAVFQTRFRPEAYHFLMMA